MARFHTDRIKNRYGWTGHNYRVLMGIIISDNAEKITNKTYRLHNDYFQKENKKIKRTEKQISLPDIADILPKQDFFRKGAEKGELICESLRRQLSSDLRAILKKPEYMYRQGAKTGLIKDKALFDFKQKIEETFSGYTRRDKETGVPPNIKNIATTELRSVVDQAKHEYNERLLKKNPDLEMTKTWIHTGNVWRTKKYKPRLHHRYLHNTTIPMSESFTLKDKVRNVKYKAPYPHYEQLPPEEVIGCQCQVVYKVKRRVKNE